MVAVIQRTRLGLERNGRAGLVTRNVDPATPARPSRRGTSRCAAARQRSPPRATAGRRSPRTRSACRAAAACRARGRLLPLEVLDDVSDVNLRAVNSRRHQRPIQQLARRANERLTPRRPRDRLAARRRASPRVGVAPRRILPASQRHRVHIPGSAGPRHEAPAATRPWAGNRVPSLCRVALRAHPYRLVTFGP